MLRLFRIQQLCIASFGLFRINRTAYTDLNQRATALTAADVVNVRFTPTVFRSGYDQDEVAAYINEILATLPFGAGRDASA